MVHSLSVVVVAELDAARAHESDSTHAVIPVLVVISPDTCAVGEISVVVVSHSVLLTIKPEIAARRSCSVIVEVGV